MAAGDLTTIAKVREHLGMTDPSATGDNAHLERLITSLSKLAAAKLGRVLGSATYTETRNGNGLTRMVLKQFPCTAVTSVTVDGETIAARSSVDGDGYVFDPDGLWIDLVGYTFTEGVSNVVIVYTAGYLTIPEEVDQAMVEWVAWRFKQKERTGQVSASVSGQTVTFQPGSVPQSVEDAIALHRVIPV